MWFFLKISRIKRINLKINLDFWVLLPYLEVMHYVINGENYHPTSCRILCFAVIVVFKDNKLGIQSNIQNKDLEKVLYNGTNNKSTSSVTKK